MDVKPWCVGIPARAAHRNALAPGQASGLSAGVSAGGSTPGSTVGPPTASRRAGDVPAYGAPLLGLNVDPGSAPHGARLTPVGPDADCKTEASIFSYIVFANS